MFSDNGPNNESRPRASNALTMGNGGVFPPQSIGPSDRENGVEVQSPSWAGNPILGKGFGYGGYDAESDVLEVGMKRHSSRQQSSRQQISRAGDRERHNDDDRDHKSSLDSEQDSSDEQRNIVPLSPRRVSRTKRS